MNALEGWARKLLKTQGGERPHGGRQRSPTQAMPNYSRHILVVDDDESVREALATGLSFTYVVHTARTGNEACTVLQRHPIAGIILDAVLGDEHGLALVPSFRQMSLAPILILTGYSTEELAISAIRVGVDEYLKKPVNLREVQAALARMMQDTGVPEGSISDTRPFLDPNLERQHPVATVAKAVGLSKRRLYRQFRGARVKPPGRYLGDRRIQRAAKLLLATGMTVKQITSAVAYPSIESFDRAFKRAFGFTPREFRRRHGNIGSRDRRGVEPIED